MKYIITESQYNLILEQQKPIPVKMRSNGDEIIEKYCKKHQVPKELIESKLPEAMEELNEGLNKKINSIFTTYPDSKTYSKVIIRTKNKIQPILQNIVKNTVYSDFGYGQYDAQVDAKNVIEIIYSELNNEINGSFVNRNLLKAAITKKNVDRIKQIFNSIVNKLASSIELSTHLPRVTISANIKTDFFKKLPYCKEVIVIEDEAYNQLKPSEQYHPKELILWRSRKFLNVDNILKPYQDKIDSMIDSFA
jgi:hypothetical protein